MKKNRSTEARLQVHSTSETRYFLISFFLTEPLGHGLQFLIIRLPEKWRKPCCITSWRLRHGYLDAPARPDPGGFTLERKTTEQVAKYLSNEANSRLNGCRHIRRTAESCTFGTTWRDGNPWPPAPVISYRRYISQGRLADWHPSAERNIGYAEYPHPRKRPVKDGIQLQRQRRR